MPQQSPWESPVCPCRVCLGRPSLVARTPTQEVGEAHPCYLGKCMRKRLAGSALAAEEALLRARQGKRLLSCGPHLPASFRLHQGAHMGACV